MRCLPAMVVVCLRWLLAMLACDGCSLLALVACDACLRWFQKKQNMWHISSVRKSSASVRKSSASVRKSSACLPAMVVVCLRWLLAILPLPLPLPLPYPGSRLALAASQGAPLPHFPSPSLPSPTFPHAAAAPALPVRRSAENVSATSATSRVTSRVTSSHIIH